MVSNSFSSLFVPKIHVSKNSDPQKRTSQPLFAGSQPDSFHRTKPSARFGASNADTEQDFIEQGLDIHNEDVRKDLLEEILGELRSSRADQRRFNQEVQTFMSDPRTTAYAALYPAQFIEKMRSIVSAANNKLKDGRDAFEMFRENITPSAGVPARVTASSSSLLNTPVTQAEDTNYDSDTPLHGHIRGGDGFLYRKEIKPGNRKQRGAYSGPYSG